MMADLSQRRCDRLRVAVILGLSIGPAATAIGAFPDGVASGDVTDFGIVLWTRVDPPVDVRVDLALDDAFGQIVHSQVLVPLAGADGAIHVDIGGLAPATRYAYRFVEVAGGPPSPTGSFRTAPPADADQPLRFVYSGDSNASHQPFRLLEFAREERPDLWFWAGDTAYADGVADGLPPATTLDEYRAKHRQNRSDPYLRDLLAAAPSIVQWDDHEVANDYDGGDLEPSIAPQRRTDAYQAFFEHMPIRRQDVPGDADRLYRCVRYGRLAEFFILDCRQYRSADVGREGGGPDPRAFFLPTLEIGTIIRLADPTRSMLGPEQLSWLKDGLARSTARWKFVLGSVPFTSLLFLPYDRWDGYVAERYDLLRFIDDQGITGVVLLSADIHGNVYNPDVTWFLRESLGQAFSPGFRVPELIAGPIATDTLEQEIRTLGASILGIPSEEFGGTLLYSLGLDFLRNLIRDRNRLDFLDGNRFAYLVVDVAADSLTLTHRAIPADSTSQADVETIHAVVLPDHPLAGCAPSFLFPAACCATIIGAAGRRGRSRRRGMRPRASPCQRRAAGVPTGQVADSIPNRSN